MARESIMSVPAARLHIGDVVLDRTDPAIERQVHAVFGSDSVPAMAAVHFIDSTFDIVPLVERFEVVEFAPWDGNFEEFA